MECAGTIEGVRAYLRDWAPTMREDREDFARVLAVLLARIATLSTNGVMVEVEWREVLSIEVKGLALTFDTPARTPTPRDPDVALDALRFAQASVTMLDLDEVGAGVRPAKSSRYPGLR